MASIIITALFFLFRTNVFTSCLMYVSSGGDGSYKHGIKRFFVERVITFILLNFV